MTLSLTFQRIIHNDNGTLVDLSADLNNYQSGTSTIEIVAADDQLVIGTELPFNHRWFEISTANSNATVASVEIWDGNNWTAAVDVVDQTDVSGVSLAQSGYISWRTDRTSGWGFQSTSEDITSLTTLKIYNMYWARLKFTADLSAGTALKHIGFKFADDDDLESYGWPDLNLPETKTAFKSDKTDWKDQHFVAAEEIIRWLKRKNMGVWSSNQLFDWEQFNAPATHKLAEIIMQSFGDDYEDQRTLARKKFNETINVGWVRADKDEDGKLDTYERAKTIGLVRI